MRTSFIFFDIAGTLLFKEHLFETIQICLREEGYSVPINELIKHHTIVSGLVLSPSKTTKEFYDSFNVAFLHSLGIIPYQKIIDSLVVHCRELSWKAYEDVNVLNTISLRKGIISNWDEKLEKTVTSLLPYNFDLIFSSSKCGIVKPNKVLYEKAFMETNIPIEEIMYIGDSVILDIEPVLSLGAQAILIDRKDQYPWYTGTRIKSLHELFTVIHT